MLGAEKSGEETQVPGEAPWRLWEGQGLHIHVLGAEKSGEETQVPGEAPWRLWEGQSLHTHERPPCLLPAASVICLASSCSPSHAHFCCSPPKEEQKESLFLPCGTLLLSSFFWVRGIFSWPCRTACEILVP